MKRQSITSLPVSPSDDRRARMRTYSIMMAVRIVCLFALLFVRGWWMWLCVAGAVILPYIAVLLANAAASPAGSAVETPGGILRVPPSNAAGSDGAGQENPSDSERTNNADQQDPAGHSRDGETDDATDDSAASGHGTARSAESDTPGTTGESP
ncbi:MAG: DUF3099 domain-containing protein [Mycetocola sp.]